MSEVNARRLTQIYDAYRSALLKKKYHHRPFDVILLGHELARVRILAGRGDGELSFRLQEFERVTGLFRSFLFADGQHLVFERGASDVGSGEQ